MFYRWCCRPLRAGILIDVMAALVVSLAVVAVGWSGWSWYRGKLEGQRFRADVDVIVATIHSLYDPVRGYRYLSNAAVCQALTGAIKERWCLRDARGVLQASAFGGGTGGRAGLHFNWYACPGPRGMVVGGRGTYAAYESSYAPPCRDSFIEWGQTKRTASFHPGTPYAMLRLGDTDVTPAGFPYSHPSFHRAQLGLAGLPPELCRGLLSHGSLPPTFVGLGLSSGSAANHIYSLGHFGFSFLTYPGGTGSSLDPALFISGSFRAGSSLHIQLSSREWVTPSLSMPISGATAADGLRQFTAGGPDVFGSLRCPDIARAKAANHRTGNHGMIYLGPPGDFSDG